MGAALTYARRYALFTLVGIAGEDDIDAPDLNTPTTASTSAAEKPIARKNGRLNGGQTHSAQPDNRGAKAIARSSRSMLGTEASAALRDRLAAELKGIRSADDAARWAHRVLGAKSTLTAADPYRSRMNFRPGWQASKALWRILTYGCRATNLRCSQPLRHVGGGVASRLIRPVLRASTRAN